MAVVGIASTCCGSLSVTVVETAMPGINLLSGFSIDDCTITLRVVVLISEPIAVTSPCTTVSLAVVTVTGKPRLIFTNQSCGTGKFTRTLLVACKDTIAVPTCKSVPKSTWRMPTRPSNGARICFFSRVARKSSTSPLADSTCWIHAIKFTLAGDITFA